MRYICLIYTNEKNDAKRTPQQMQQLMADYGAFTNGVKENGAYRAGDALQTTSTATTVQVKDGKTLTTDGPFAETKEQLGGFYILDCKDLDEAIAHAAKIPAAEHGSVEVRPIIEFEK